MKRAVVLFGHGSRDPAWRAVMDAVADRICQRQADVPVACAFLELQQPDLAAAVDSLASGGATHVHVLPMFLGVGKHAREDLPRLLDAVRLQHPGLTIVATAPVGERPAVVDLLAELALQHP